MKHLSSELIMSLSFHLPGAYIITFSLSCIWRQDQDVLCVLFTQALALLTECFCVSLFVCFFNRRARFTV